MDEELIGEEANSRVETRSVLFKDKMWGKGKNYELGKIFFFNSRNVFNGHNLKLTVEKEEFGSVQIQLGAIQNGGRFAARPMQCWGDVSVHVLLPRWHCRTWRAADFVWILSWTGTDMRGRSALLGSWMKMKTQKIPSTVVATPSNQIRGPRRRKVWKSKNSFHVSVFLIGYLAWGPHYRIVCPKKSKTVGYIQYCVHLTR